ncbi:single-stranded-DNA-specific exonuclease [Oceanospirillum multiglobuliferum]|uniref:Single-stranded-DNA-specific exonuclease RecJ n=1 Tax=Oceanospirillum multiglobuliferum TaxID=64969 RepID=A0A1T4M906_9GAMM|nr:single-stranded-DNA-specific exonuclease RecJ [Oceanospirillum multiglobuliferum]OPX56209.1 single-stranded-DNA-specific exonuclease RecJ [Oceanospirillum multiglobuliferum]SJZ63184.1 single-stranded-DNA-specific exonuclease [Oceanospirillum multiglobuliferum]
MPEIKQRNLNPAVYEQALTLGLSPLVAKVLAGRISDSTIDLQTIVQPELRYLPHPERLKDAVKAAQRIAQAIIKGEVIGILTDYDVDGITSHVVFYRTLTEWFGVSPDKVQSLIGHRINDGYGVSAGLVARILSQPVLPDLIITADCGSSDEARIALLRQAGIEVIVTDHHALPESGVPESAFAVVNPTQADCDYPDATIAGCMVAWLVMSSTRNHLIQKHYLPVSSPKLSKLLSYVALGTVADCVSLGQSAVNRAVVRTGLTLINQFDQPCWRAFRRLLKKDNAVFTPDMLGFQLGPRINARGRLDDPYAALHFMLSAYDHQADHYLSLLDQDNEDRKAIEQEMATYAQGIATEQVLARRQGLAIVVPDGHAGVQGIVASRVTQKTGKPSVVLCPALNPDHLSGSARSVDQVHIRDVLQLVAQQHSEVLVKFGGHKGAAGLTILRSQQEIFAELFDWAVKQQLSETEHLNPTLWVDEHLAPEQINIETWQQLQQLQPYGREFDNPMFLGVFFVEQLRPVGADQSHLQLLLSCPNTGFSFKAIWFKALAAGAKVNFQEGANIKVAYQLSLNEYKGQSSVQLLVEWAE